MSDESNDTSEYEVFLDHILRELERQDQVKFEIVHQGQKMTQVLFLGVSGILAAVTAFGPVNAAFDQCAVSVLGSCFKHYYLITISIMFAVLSSIFYISLSGIDYVAPFSIVEDEDTHSFLKYSKSGEQFYRSRISVLSERLQVNHRHIRALELIGAIGGVSLVTSIFFLSVTLYAMFFGKIPELWFAIMIVLLYVVLFVGHYAQPRATRKRELKSPISGD